MSPYRGSDEAIDREIAAIERIAKVRLRRAAAEMRALDRDLRELKRERARRRAETTHAVTEEIPSDRLVA
jgi:septal ring factor EnvC (AmiA/AmiB activator)